MIDIGADKTRLQVYAKKGFMVEKDVETPIFINEQNIPFTDLNMLVLFARRVVMALH